MKPLISIIVPIYNVKDYLCQCVESLIRQTYDNLEILLIDDGSTDGCSEICDKYEKTDNRIKVIHKPNGGLSSARNAGLDIATGSYIYFIDSDDWIENNMLDFLSDKMAKNDADIVACGFYNSFATSDILATPEFSDYIIENTPDIFYRMLPDSKNSIRFMVWNKLYKRDVIGDIRFLEGQIYEDLHFERCVMQRVNRLLAISEPFYHYRQCRPGNTSSLFKIQKLVKFEELDQYICYLEEIGIAEYVNGYIKYALDSAIEIYSNASMLKQNQKIKSLIFDNYKKYYKKNITISGKQKYKYMFFRFFPNLYVFLR